MPGNSRIHIICALKCEAAPLLNHFKLEHKGREGLFNCYFNDENKISLTQTGIGKINAAAGTMHAIREFEARENDVWLNIGIAGHGSMPVGSAVLANRIKDSNSGSLWFPQILVDLPAHSCGLITMETPSFNYSNEMIDMEAAGFYASAGRVGTSELIHCLKIISDNELSSPIGLKGKHVSALIENKILIIEETIYRLRDLSGEIFDSTVMPNHYHSFTDNWHFTEYQKFRLRSLLNRWRVIMAEKSPINESMWSRKSGKEILLYLEQELDSAPVDY